MISYLYALTAPSLKHLLRIAVAAVLMGPAMTASGEGLDALFHEGGNVAERCSVAEVQTSIPVLIDEIFPQVVYKTPGRDLGSEQLFKPIRTISEPLAQLGSACLGGKKSSCQRFATWVQDLADANALRFDREKHKQSPVSFVSGTLSGNLSLRPIALYSGVLLKKRLIAFPDNGSVFQWLRQRAKDYEHAPRGGKPKLAQNLVLSSAATQQAVGIAIGDQTLTGRANEIFEAYIDTMRSDGSFPEETSRGQSALKYSNMAVAGLVLVAELASTTGIDLYSYTGPHGDIHDAVAFLLNAVDDETIIEPYAIARISPTDAIQPGGGQARAFLKSQFGWIDAYLARFPEFENATRIRNLIKTKGLRSPSYYDETLGAHADCIWGRLGVKN
jgi:hypothetical protein